MLILYRRPWICFIVERLLHWTEMGKNVQKMTLISLSLDLDIFAHNFFVCLHFTTIECTWVGLFVWEEVKSTKDNPKARHQNTYYISLNSLPYTLAQITDPTYHDDRLLSIDPSTLQTKILYNHWRKRQPCKCVKMLFSLLTFHMLIVLL